MYTTAQTNALNMVHKTMLKAEQVFGRSFTTPPVTFNLKGRTAGIYRWNPVNGFCSIRLNNILLKENEDVFIEQTVPHELAHHITRVLYGRVSPHGREWKSVMIRLGVSPTRCHDYDVTNSQVRRGTRYVYSCDKCGKEHNITAYKHSRASRYRCKCHGDITFTGRVI